MPREANLTDPTPIPGSYWLIEGMLLAGEYPAASHETASRKKLSKFLDAGIRTFIDLTEEDEPLDRYDDLLHILAAERGIDVKHVRYAVEDMGLPSEREHMMRILTTIREEIDAGRPVYVHCWGGIGRTGTVIGCWLVESGLAGKAAIEKIAKLRARLFGGRQRSPETDDQCRYIHEWTAAK
jgi:protein-tyrosine phosphatase